MLRQYAVDIIPLSKVNDISQIGDRLGFNKSVVQSSCGFSGGLFLGWKAEIKVTIKEVSWFFIIAEVANEAKEETFFSICCYSPSSRGQQRRDICSGSKLFRVL